MSPAIVALVLISAALHPLREFLIKGSPTPEGVSFAVIFLFGVFSTIHVVVLGGDPWSAFEIWPLVLVSSLGVAGYYISVVATLRHGDLSIYYPIVRSSPLFIVGAGILFLGHSYSISLLLGVALVLVGAFLLQYRPGARVLSQPRTLALGVLAMSAHGVVTLADAEAMKSIEPTAFLFLEYLILDPVTAVIFVVTRPGGRSVYRHLLAGWFETPFRFIGVGLTSYASYYLILTAFQLGANVAAVASVRQISIPISVLLGGLILKEARLTGRLAWSLVLALGVVMIILSK